MAVVLILVLGSTAGNMNAKKAGDDGVNNPDRCLQAGKDDGRDSGTVSRNSIHVGPLMNTDL